MGIILFRILIVYLVYLGIKSLLNKFLGPVKDDTTPHQASKKTHDNSKKDSPIEADYRVIK